MPELSLGQWDVLALVIATTLISGLVRGFTGFGGPAIMVLVLTQFYAPASVVGLVLVVDYVANLQLFPGAVRHATWRTTGPLTAASVIALPIGVYALQVMDPLWLKRGIALTAGVATCVMLTNWRYQRQPGLVIGVVVGFVSGVIVGATFIALPLMVFFFAGPSSAAEARANAIAWGLFISTGFGALFYWHGLLDVDDVWQAALIALLYVLGTHLGARAFKKVSEKRFRQVVLICLLVLSGIGVAT